MKVIIHAGMPKTGSTSIQWTFANRDQGHVRYFRWLRPAHNDLIILLFDERGERFLKYRLKNYGPKEKGYSREELLLLREEWLESFEQDLTQPGADTCLLSAEAISNGRLWSVLTPLKAFLEKYSDDIQVIAYVRPPVSFMASAFQQRIKFGDKKEFNPKEYWPRYRQRFERLDQVFGRENVTLRKFDRKTLKNGSVVDDLAEFAGIPVPYNSSQSKNESLSLEALALLFVQRKFGRGKVTGFRDAQDLNEKVFESLAGIGKEKFQFAPELVLPIVEANEADLEWMERRLSEPLRETPENLNGPLLRSEQDLLSIADQSFPELEALAPDPPTDVALSTRENIIRKMDKLHEMSPALRVPAGSRASVYRPRALLTFGVAIWPELLFKLRKWRSGWTKIVW